MGVEVSGFLGLILLVADIWAIVNVFQSRSTTGKKLSDGFHLASSDNRSYFMRFNGTKIR